MTHRHNKKVFAMSWNGIMSWNDEPGGPTVRKWSPGHDDDGVVLVDSRTGEAIVHAVFKTHREAKRLLNTWKKAKSRQQSSNQTIRTWTRAQVRERIIIWPAAKYALLNG